MASNTPTPQPARQFAYFEKQNNSGEFEELNKFIRDKAKLGATDIDVTLEREEGTFHITVFYTVPAGYEPEMTNSD